MLEHTGCSLQSLARKSLDLGEDKSHLDTIASSHSFSGKATLTINEEQSPLSSGVEERRSPEGSVALNADVPLVAVPLAPGAVPLAEGEGGTIDESEPGAAPFATGTTSAIASTSVCDFCFVG
jgi:hypothetical protein